jgi:hypothetical protein
MEATTSVKKFVVVLNRSHELSRLTSGLGHVTAGLAASLTQTGEDLRFLTYESADGQQFSSISDYSFIVLKGRRGQLKTFHAALREKELPCVTYLDTMLEGGTAVEMAATKQRNFEDLEVLAIATFGDVDVLNGLTKKFSLWQ